MEEEEREGAWLPFFCYVPRQIARASLQGGGRLLFANRPALPLPLCFSSKPFSKD